jgi:hypothetical protein
MTSLGRQTIALQLHLAIVTTVRGPFEKSVDKPYYSELEVCRSAVTVSFSKYLLWQKSRDSSVV